MLEPPTNRYSQFATLRVHVCTGEYIIGIPAGVVYPFFTIEIIARVPGRVATRALLRVDKNRPHIRRWHGFKILPCL